MRVPLRVRWARSRASSSSSVIPAASGWPVRVAQPPPAYPTCGIPVACSRPVASMPRRGAKPGEGVLVVDRANEPPRREVVDLVRALVGYVEGRLGALSRRGHRRGDECVVEVGHDRLPDAGHGLGDGAGRQPARDQGWLLFLGLAGLGAWLAAVGFFGWRRQERRKA